MGYQDDRRELQRKALVKWLDDNFHIRALDHPSNDELLDSLIDAVENPERILGDE